MADDCRGQLTAIEFEVPQKGMSLCRWPVNEYLGWAVGGSSISIHGLQQADLEVVVYNPSQYQDQYHIQLAYAQQSLRQTHVVNMSIANILLVISIASKNCLPLCAVCLLRRTEYGGYELILKDSTMQSPNIGDYQQVASL